jgi:signal transduction histidine kinase/ActR/RegA family two-component response regulator
MIVRQEQARDMDLPELQALLHNPRSIQIRLVLSTALALVLLNCIYAYDTLTIAIVDAKRSEISHYLLRIQAISIHAENAYSDELREFGGADAGRVSEELFEHLRQEDHLNVTVPSYLEIRIGGETHSVSTGLLDSEVLFIISSMESKPIENFLKWRSLQNLTKNLDTFTYTEVESDDYLIGRMAFTKGNGSIVFAQKSNLMMSGLKSTTQRTLSFALVIVWLGVWFAFVISMVIGRQLKKSNGAIRQAIDSQERVNINLEGLVAERTADLSAANAKLILASRSKDEFLANMSHELRTPLNAILNMSECLEEGIYGPINEKQKRAVGTVASSGQHLLSLINDILDLAKLGAGTMKLSMETVIAEDICHASIGLIKESAHKKKVKVTTSFDKQVTTIRADSRRLQQILVNLLSNAVKFTPEGGTIGLDVTGSPENETVLFSVWDTGIGISTEEQSDLFKPFVQLDAGLNRAYEGTGLGLSLVAQMTELHGGGVHVESRGYGLGSRFTISLPWSEAMIKEGSPNAPDPQIGTPLVPVVSSKEGPGTESGVDSHPLILLAEDNEDNIAAVSDFLQAKGYRIVVARNGAEALDLAWQEPPDLILMDIQMPKLDGLAATREIRKDPDFAGVPIIALTALAMAGDRERCLAAGTNEYMTKPVSLKKLDEAIEMLLSGAAE